MKVVAFNGSPRKDGNTAILLQKVLFELEEKNIQTEMVQLAGNPIRGCIACGMCAKKKNKKCALESDVLNECLEKMIEADGIILGSPTYFADATADIKALMDRAGYVSLANGRLLKRKVGAAVVAVRRGGAIHVFDTLNHFFTINEMIIPGSSYWNMGFGRDIGEVAKDDEGLKTMTTLGQNMAWLLGKLKSK